MHILIIDDEPALRQILTARLTGAGHTVEEAVNLATARAKLTRGDFDVALCDMRMPDGDGLQLLRESKQTGVDTTFVIVTAFGSVETAVEALRAGAFDYVTKPVSGEEVLHRLTQIAALRGLREENRALRRVVSETVRPPFRFGSPSMQEVDRLVAKVAPTDSTVLITGESGTGKTMIARSIHAQSARNMGSFVAVNCGAIPETLLEAEFFGHTKGAFTSADRARKGLFVQADRGTLFLDEVGELPLAMQTKLLHAIEEKEVRPLGSEQSRRVNVRLVAATNRDMQAMVREGRFREDLFFRLGVFHIHVPPLRERGADMRAFIRHLLAAPAQAGGDGSRATEIDAAAEHALLAHTWPGNARELENVLARAKIVADGDRITLADLPAALTHLTPAQRSSAEGAPGTLRAQMRRHESDIIMRSLEDSDGDRRIAAQRLGIGLSSLYRKIEELEIRDRVRASP
jgi:two-component system, NtrC family, response regulator AtoC